MWNNILHISSSCKWPLCKTLFLFGPNGHLFFFFFCKENIISSVRFAYWCWFSILINMFNSLTEWWLRKEFHQCCSLKKPPSGRYKYWHKALHVYLIIPSSQWICITVRSALRTCLHKLYVCEKIISFYYKQVIKINDTSGQVSWSRISCWFFPIKLVRVLLIS